MKRVNLSQELHSLLESKGSSLTMFIKEKTIYTTGIFKSSDFYPSVVSTSGFILSVIRNIKDNNVLNALLDYIVKEGLYKNACELSYMKKGHAMFLHSFHSNITDDEDTAELLKLLKGLSFVQCAEGHLKEPCRSNYSISPD